MLNLSNSKKKICISRFCGSQVRSWFARCDLGLHVGFVDLGLKNTFLVSRCRVDGGRFFGFRALMLINKVTKSAYAYENISIHTESATTIVMGILLTNMAIVSKLSIFHGRMPIVAVAPKVALMAGVLK